MIAIEPFHFLFRYRYVITQAVASEMAQRYAGLVAGRLWMLISPILLMSFYSTVYILIFKIRPANMEPSGYVLYILAGIIPFLSFIEALTSGSGALTGNRALLLNTVFPAELIPVRAVLVSQAVTFPGILLVLIVAIAMGKASAAMLIAPLVLILLIMLVTGIVWILSITSLVLRDIQPFLAFLSLALMILSPIAYTPDMVPASLSFLIYFNPLSYYITSLQHIVVLGVPPTPVNFIVMVLLSLGSFILGFRTFRRLKPVMVDYA